MERKKRIILCSNTAFSLYNFRFRLARTLKEKGFDVYLIAPEDDYAEKLKKEFPFIPLRHLERKGKNPIKDLKLFLEFLRTYSKIKPDLAIHYTIKPNIYGSLAANFLGIPNIAVITGLGHVFISNSILKSLVVILYKLAFKKTNYVIFQNSDDMNEFIKNNIISKEKAKVIYGSGVDTERFNPEFCKDISENSIFKFLLIARLLWEKGIKEYVQAAKIIKSKYSNVEFRILGNFDKDNPSCVPREYIENLHKEGIINYLGFSEDVRPFISKSDVVVLPSYREGLPRVLLEAMAMGKPIITTDAPGCREVVLDGYNGFMVKVRDVESLVEAFEKVLNSDKKTLKQMGYNGRKLVEDKFSDEVVVKQMLELIEEILRKR
ncbi:glycosyltransferase family 4 protein [Thermodesulfovibrio sp. 3907-1M]|uniref:Glycosyltransferase family 4 protein n=1 Tax=Thermodesulfovibrio autotrophicus TaxID=3118333 RepID=A0AAU8H072_9BACT